MRGARSLIRQVHQILHLPRKMTLMIDPYLKWNVRYNARSIRSHPPTSPNTVPATKNESHDWSASHIERPVQCAEQQDSSAKLTKRCAWHEKWLRRWILFSNETSSTMCGATGVILQVHQILHLRRNFKFKISAENPWVASANIETIRG